MECFKQFLILLFISYFVSCIDHHSSPDVNEFAEFDDYVDDTTFKDEKKVDDKLFMNEARDQDEYPEHEFGGKELENNGESKEKSDDEADVEDGNEDEFVHFEDEDEFEGYQQSYEINDDIAKNSFDKDEFEHNPSKLDKPNSAKGDPFSSESKTIKIAKLPTHLRKNWDSYQLEIIIITGIILYFVNFFTGKSWNYKVASAWLKAHYSILDQNFAMVGDAGGELPAFKCTYPQSDLLIKESENLYSLWCSGRVCCEGMLVELLMLKRQDLISVITNYVKPSHDQVHIKFLMNSEDMDTFVFCISQKKIAGHLIKSMADLKTFCPEKRSCERYGIPANFCVMSEMSELCSSLIDAKILSMLQKYPNFIESIHFSDKYVKTASSDQGQTTPANEIQDSRKVLSFVFNIILDPNLAGSLETSMQSMIPLLNLAFHCVDKIKRFRLSNEAKLKADKNRSKVAESYWKSIHMAKAEKAQEDRERKRREFKEKLMEIEDPVKQKKMEEKENRREKKKNAPRVKQLKVKTM